MYCMHSTCTCLLWTYVAFPSFRKTEDKETSRSIFFIFLETGFSLSCNSCSKGKAEAYRTISTDVVANTFL